MIKRVMRKVVVLSLSCLFSVVVAVDGQARRSSAPAVIGDAAASTIRIEPGCERFDWPLVSVSDAIPNRKWIAIAVKALCRHFAISVGESLVIVVREDGLVTSVNGRNSTDIFLPAAYGGAVYTAEGSSFEMNGVGRASWKPSGLRAEVPVAVQEEARLRREIRQLVMTEGLSGSDTPVFLRIARNGAIEWGGMASQSRTAIEARGRLFDECIAHHWDLPFERSIVCSARASLVSLEIGKERQ